jgi:hypothetical protein
MNAPIDIHVSIDFSKVLSNRRHRTALADVLKEGFRVLEGFALKALGSIVYRLRPGQSNKRSDEEAKVLTVLYE